MFALAHGAKKENQEREDAPDPLKVTNGHSSQGTDQVSQKRLVAPTIPVQCVRLTVPYRLASCPSVSRLRNTALAALLAGVASCDLIFMGGEGGQDFGLLALRNLEEVQGPSEFRGHRIEFRGGDPKVPVRLLQAERRR
jgi:hypothetical protein